MACQIKPSRLHRGLASWDVPTGEGHGCSLHADCTFSDLSAVCCSLHTETSHPGPEIDKALVFLCSEGWRIEMQGARRMHTGAPVRVEGPGRPGASNGIGGPIARFIDAYRPLHREPSEAKCLQLLDVLAQMIVWPQL